MIADLKARRNQLRPRRRTEEWESARRRLGPYTRELIDCFMQHGVAPRQIVRRALGPPARPQWRDDRRATRALICVLLHGALDVFTWLLDEPWSTAGRAYELFFREDFPIADCGAPPTLAGAIVRALDQGEPMLAALVTREVASRLGRREPGPALANHVSRRLGFFKLLAFEAYEIMLEKGCLG